MKIENYKLKNASAVILVTSFLLFVAVQVHAAKLYFAPDADAHYIGDPFVVEILLDSEGEAINAAEGGILFLSENVEIVDVTKSNSIFSLWIQEPVFDNREGLVLFSGGVASPGFDGADGKISSITLRGKSGAKEVALSFQENSRALLNDGNGTKAALTLVPATYTFLEKPAEFLRVSSPTHGDQTKWYNISTAVFNWGIAGRDVAFSYLLDRNKETLPDTVSEGIVTSVEYRDLTDGIWYFHIRKSEKNRWSDPVHFRIQIDTQPPASFEPSVSISDLAYDGKYFLVFSARDALSGVDRYEILEADQRGLTRGLTQKEEWKLAKSPYVLEDQGSGKHTVKVRAYDRAGNIREESISFVIPKKKLQQVLTVFIIFVMLVILSAVFLKRHKVWRRIIH